MVLSQARRFVYPVYADFHEDRDEQIFDPLLAGLCGVVSEIAIKRDQ